MVTTADRHGSGRGDGRNGGIDLVRSGRYGAPRIIEACNTQVQGPGEQWRMRGALAGGGALPDRPGR